MSVEFPFEEVQDVHVAFGGIANYDEVLKACPKDFYERNPFSALAEKWFEVGLNPAEDLAGYNLTAETTEDAIMQRKYIESWMRSFRPKHETKIAVSGWLLSLMLELADPDGQ